MVKNRLLLISTITILLLISCNKELVTLTMDKKPYNGNELRTDGYYYSDLAEDGFIAVSLLYKNGFCIHTWVRYSDIKKNIFDYIENDILLNSTLIDKMKNVPSHIGIFKVEYPQINIEAWEYRTMLFFNSGKILNDTTFVITKREDRKNKYINKQERTYHFKQFSPKPDSTSVFIP